MINDDFDSKVFGSILLVLIAVGIWLILKLAGVIG